jgi:hypothetical protein
MAGDANTQKCGNLEFHRPPSDGRRRQYTDLRECLVEPRILIVVIVHILWSYAVYAVTLIDLSMVLGTNEGNTTTHNAATGHFSVFNVVIL